MENKQIFEVKSEETMVTDGKVMISSEELAEAIQSYDFELNAEEEAEAAGNHVYVICFIK